VNLPVVVTVPSENIPQEHQLHMQAVFIAKSSRTVQERLFNGWWWWDLALKKRLLWVGLCYTLWPKESSGLLRISMSRKEMALPFSPHSEMNALMDARKSFCLSSLWPDDDGVVHIAEIDYDQVTK
jgi:hypothetical protein